MNCECCGKAFQARTLWQKFCSSRCKQRTYKNTCEKCGAKIYKYASTCMGCRPPSRIRDAEYFWSQVDKKEKNDCWIWNGAKSLSGYGRITCNGKKEGTHRISWRLTYGDIPGGMYVCHHCDNPPCCNPDHLFLGTHTDNMADMQRKGRNRGQILATLAIRGENHWSKTPRGREILSLAMKEKFRNGKRIALRDAKTGRIRGTKKLE